MLHQIKLPFDQMVGLLKAAGEPTRLRILALLSGGDLTVSDLIEILGQSQPRISRHLRLLSEAGLLERYSEGAWAYFRLAGEGAPADFVKSLIGVLNREDPQFLRDAERLEGVRAKRARQAADYFSGNAGAWDAIRSLHVDEAEVEKTMREMIGSTPFQTMLDLGTGTGRMLELFSDLYLRAVGIDQNREMLGVARANLDKAGLSQAQIRQGNIANLPTPQDHFNLVTLHQVLHYLEDPQTAINQAAKALCPGGRLLIVDFAPHDLEFLRDEHAHIRLGFAAEQVSNWLESAGLELRQVKKLPPSKNTTKSKGGLTVTLWLAKDQRMLIA